MRCRESTGDANIELPLVIMTSGDTDAPTRALLEQENNTGHSDSQVMSVSKGCHHGAAAAAAAAAALHFHACSHGSPSVIGEYRDAG